MVFQWGWGADLIGLESTVPIVSFIPMFMFAILFGLSMDYEVFLLSRVREEYLRTGDNGAADRRRHRQHRPGHHLGGADHGRGVPGLRPRRRPVDQDVRPRPGHRDPHRRHGRPDGAGAGDHDAARPRQLVAARWLDRVLPRVTVDADREGAHHGGGDVRPLREPVTTLDVR